MTLRFPLTKGWGMVSINMNAPEEGTSMIRPLSRREDLNRALAETEMAPSPNLTGRHILIVEDEGLLALDMEFALVDAGAKVLGPAVEVAEGVQLLSGTDTVVDGAILDLDLRGVAAYPIADMLHERGVPFLFHTGHGRAADLQARYGADLPVFTKPSRLETVLATLARMIDGNR